MAEASLVELNERIEFLEREVGDLRARIDQTQPKKGWRDVAGSMADVDDETWAAFRGYCDEVRTESGIQIISDSEPESQ
ncbi:MAG: hypothetical protein ACI8UO_001025 [Verrucomicrobiales bacterium]|jgi:hypothetical protein